MRRTESSSAGVDQTLILKSMIADRLQHLGGAAFFQVRSENQSWPSLPALHTDVHSELHWTPGDTTEEEFDRITCTFPHQVRLCLLVWCAIVRFYDIIAKSHLKRWLNNIFKEKLFKIARFRHVKKYYLKHLIRCKCLRKT